MSSVEGVTVPASPAVLAPVSGGERILTLDILRGIALFGVITANVWLWFSGVAFLFPAYREQLRQLSLDSFVFVAMSVLVSGKAMTTFSFLFGLGFAVQMLRAEARGRSVVPVYARRLTVLLLIGVAHMVLLWYGDILTVYALFGFLLLLFRKRRDRTLLVWATILIAGVPLALGTLPLVLSAFGVSMPVPDMAAIANRNATTLAVFDAGSYPEIVRRNLFQAGQFYVGQKTPFLLYVAGLFILGLYVGRRRIFENVEAHRRGFRRIASWGIPIGLAAGVGMVVMQATVEQADVVARPALMLLMATLFVTSTVPLAAGYVSLATLLVRHPGFARTLSAFAPVGRMALTNYLSQTVVMLLIFYPYGGGLIGDTGPAAAVAIGIVVYAVQMVWSSAWLARFQFGPMEWLWRSATYGRLQPMRIRTESAASAAPAGALSASAQPDRASSQTPRAGRR